MRRRILLAAVGSALLSSLFAFLPPIFAAEGALDPKARADKVVVLKGKRELTLLRKGEALRR